MDGLTIEKDFHIETRRHGRKKLEPGKAPAPRATSQPGSTPRISKLMALAIRFEERLERGDVRDMAQLARYGRVTRARLTQIMNLRLLAPDIQEELLRLPRVTQGRAPIRYKDLAQITLEPQWTKQRKRWQSLRELKVKPHN